MQAIELNAVITQNHEIHLKLPDDATASYARVIVMYENNEKDAIKPLAKNGIRSLMLKASLMMIFLLTAMKYESQRLHLADCFC